MKSTSWVIIQISTNKVIMETFNPKLVELINTKNYKVVPIYEYLVSLNQR
jgi:hypothetical protein